MYITLWKEAADINHNIAIYLPCVPKQQASHSSQYFVLHCRVDLTDLILSEAQTTIATLANLRNSRSIMSI